MKGDVHDIGKNIVGVVLGCNNYDVIDLGVMTPIEKIVEVAQKENVDIVGFSGLITPSLDEMVFNAKEFERLGLKIPILIGGATTSRIHTAVKIAPQYSAPVIHVLDASRSVGVVASLIAKDGDFLDDIKEQYEELRDDYVSTRLDRKYYSFEDAKARAMKIDWNSKDRTPIVAPTFFGTKVFDRIPLENLIDYIDWIPFFSVWELRGKYPNRRFPAIFNDPNVGEAAKKLYDEAKEMLQNIIRLGTLRACGVIGFYPAASTGEDIELYSTEDHADVVGCLRCLRQQEERDESQGPSTVSLADFVAPKGAGVKDYVGMFVVSIFGADECVKKYEEQHDTYNAILVKALADRLAEAAAEYLHERVRVQHWGYSPAETLSNEDRLKVKYQGIRPAPGYPSQPDHTEKSEMWRIMNVQSVIGSELTESLAMYPAASVSGLYFGNPEAKYFSLGKIQKDQVISYADRKGWDVQTAEKHLRYTLSYDP